MGERPWNDGKVREREEVRERGSREGAERGGNGERERGEGGGGEGPTDRDACVRTHTHKHTHARTHARAHTHTQAHAQTHTRAHTHTHAHTKAKQTERDCNSKMAMKLSARHEQLGRFDQNPPTNLTRYIHTHTEHTWVEGSHS